MKLLNFLFGSEVREGNYHPSATPPKWITSFNDSSAGVNVDESTVLGIAAAYRCINILANSLACLPIHTYKTKGAGKTRVTEDPVYQLLHNKPNRFMTSLYFFQTMMGNAALTGNSYAQLIRNNAGAVVEMLPLNPNFVTPVLYTPEGGAQVLRYIYKPTGLTAPLILREDQVIHIKGLSGDGLVGHSPIRTLREVFGMATAIERHGATVFKNGANIRGILRHPAKLDKGIADYLRQQWQELYSGSDNAGKTAVLEEGMDWKQITMSLQDAQFLEQRRYQAGDVCVVYGVPPHMIGNLDRSTFSNMEQQDLFFLRYTMLTWVKTFEQELNDKLFRNNPKMFVEFQINGFARADQASRYTAYATGIQNGFITRNEVRAWENLDPKDGLDEILTPLNMKEGQGESGPTPNKTVPNEPRATLDQPIKPVKTDEKMPVAADKEAKSEVFRPIFKEILDRALTREFNKKPSLKDAAKLAEAHLGHSEFLFKILRNTAVSFCWNLNGSKPSTELSHIATDCLRSWIDSYMKVDRQTREQADAEIDLSIDKLLQVLWSGQHDYEKRI